MTSKQAGADMFRCEQEIIRTHSELCESARKMLGGSYALRRSYVKKQMIAFFIAVVGSVIAVFVDFLFGLLVTFAGFILLVNLHKMMEAAVKKLKVAEQVLSDVINRNGNIN